MIWGYYHFRKHPNGLAIKFILFTRSVHMPIESMSMYRISITSIYHKYQPFLYVKRIPVAWMVWKCMEMHGCLLGNHHFHPFKVWLFAKLDLEKTFSVGPKTTCKWGDTLPKTNNNFAPENKPKPKRKTRKYSNHPFSGAKMLVVGRV